tara:strand:+ start:246 stop:419 length:174 start_codon:yes stop_codon:yes gene_type:complete
MTTVIGYYYTKDIMDKSNSSHSLASTNTRTSQKISLAAKAGVKTVNRTKTLLFGEKN